MRVPLRPTPAHCSACDQDITVRVPGGVTDALRATWLKRERCSKCGSNQFVLTADAVKDRFNDQVDRTDPGTRDRLK